MTFKEKLVKLRKLKGLTQDDFANAVGVSRQAVYKWESGQSYPEVPKLVEIKKVLEISIDDLLDENYEVVLPEKKRRKRAPKAVEPAAEVAAEPVVEAEPAPVAEPVVEETAPVAEPVVEPVAEETAPVAEPATEPVAEETAPVAEPVVEPVVEEPAPVEPAPAADEPKKKGFFARLFGNK